jgi:hypothetical protein
MMIYVSFMAVLIDADALSRLCSLTEQLPAALQNRLRRPCSKLPILNAAARAHP